ncbi:hypothetical protein Vafri_13662 [Volvox africanus]|uniref:Uncharacterized protein n=1 Tax=Volvox africanus TaxID=51714 RepID=A0A8J4BCD9_9CHLO|nr:hypothetical protein Vafri_13662 [Volvox africanus]
MKTCHFGRARLQSTVSALQSVSSTCGCHQNDNLSHSESGILFSVPVHLLAGTNAIRDVTKNINFCQARHTTYPRIHWSVQGVLARISRLYNLWHGWSTWILHPGPAFPVVTSYFRDISNAVAMACNLHKAIADGDDAEDFFWVNPPLELASSSRATPSDVDVDADAGAGTVSTRTSASFTTTVSISHSDPGSAADSAPDSGPMASRGQGKG